MRPSSTGRGPVRRTPPRARRAPRSEWVAVLVHEVVHDGPAPVLRRVIALLALPYNHVTCNGTASQSIPAGGLGFIGESRALREAFPYRYRTCLAESGAAGALHERADGGVSATRAETSEQRPRTTNETADNVSPDWCRVRLNRRRRWRARNVPWDREGDDVGDEGFERKILHHAERYIAPSRGGVLRIVLPCRW